MVFRASTDDVDFADRADYWQYICRELLGSVEPENFRAGEFASSVEAVQVGPIRFVSFAGTGQTFRSTQSSLRTHHSDDYVIALESEAKSFHDHCGRQRLGFGGIHVADLAKSYTVDYPQGLDVLGVIIPRKMMDNAFGAMRLVTGMCMEQGQATSSVLSNFLRDLGRNGKKLDASTAERMASIAVEMIAAGLSEKAQDFDAVKLSGAATLCRVQAFVSDHIGAAGLTMAEVARAVGVSVRRLHQISAEEGVSLVDWMWDRRLQRAHAMLAQPATGRQSIQAIAWGCGFADQAHFSRRFKDRFGLSPTELRSEHIGPPSHRNAPAG